MLSEQPCCKERMPSGRKLLVAVGRGSFRREPLRCEPIAEHRDIEKPDLVDLEAAPIELTDSSEDFDISD